jgi:hypothetical protein
MTRGEGMTSSSATEIPLNLPFSRETFFFFSLKEDPEMPYFAYSYAMARIQDDREISPLRSK